MDLQEKYKKLIDYAKASNIENLSIFENTGVLYIAGETSLTVKNKIWDLYNEIDPDMRSGDLVLEIKANEGEEQYYEVQSGDSLSKIAKNYPGMTWQKIFEANNDTIKDPNKIFPGQKLKIPVH